MKLSTPSFAELRGRRKGAVTAAADTPTKTGSMIAWYPSAAERKEMALDLDGAELADEIHVTLFYTGKAADLDGPTRDKILMLTAVVAKAFGPIEMRDQGTGFFKIDPQKNDGNDRCVVALWDSPDMQKVRETLCTELLGSDIPVSMDHGFTAHSTLIYLAASDDLPTEIFDRPEHKFTAGGLTVCFGPEQHYFPFGGAQQLTALEALELALQEAVE